MKTKKYSKIDKEIYKMLNEFIRLCHESLEKENDVPVVAANFHFFDMLYPNKIMKEKNPKQEMLNSLVSYCNFLEISNEIFPKAYFKKLDFKTEIKNITDIEQKTHTLYGSLWEDFDFNILDEAAKLLKARMEKNDFDISWLKGKTVLDDGCGSGRYSFALKKLGAGKVIGIDMGNQGIAFAKRCIKKTNTKGVEFKIGSVLALPFKDESFDFVFSNGVLHHTKDPVRGMKEIYRVMKTEGKAWFYVYGKSGLFGAALDSIRGLMKKIPRERTKDILTSLCLPRNRFIFMDNWYVPIREDYSIVELEKILKGIGFNRLSRLERGVEYDLNEPGGARMPDAEFFYGEGGELRYILEK